MSIQRDDILREIGAGGEWDVLVIGGGATGLGTAVEAAARGYRTLLLEAHDFAKATSSRSTKLVHGGVRYLQQGNLKLVLEALRERGRMLRNAPHLAHRRAFIIPAYARWELPFYGIGLTLYDLLARKERLGRSKILGIGRVLEALPTVHQAGLKGGILYYDGQFDDARYAIALLRTLFDLGGFALNYAKVIALTKRDGRVSGAVVSDEESGEQFEIPAKVTINATGIFADAVRYMDEPKTTPVITVSQGSHVVLPRSFLPGDSALMVPRTADGRVLFAIPWHDRVVIGTTDDPVPRAELEPRSAEDERQFLLAHIEKYLDRRPTPAEILSVWSGQRPLVKPPDAKNTAAISRDHTILVSDAKLMTVTGGKWTTYRRMGQDAIDRAAPLAGLPKVVSRTADLRLHGWSVEKRNDWAAVYGADLAQLRLLANERPELEQTLHARLPFQRAEAVWAARFEMARTVEDVLARRTRALFLDARASLEAAPLVARLVAGELGRDEKWEHQQVVEFQKTAESYVWS